MNVCVLTPSFNYGRFLPDCIRSVQAQGSGWTQVVMDGASTDETVEVLREFEGPQLRWVSEPDRGQSDALNKALALAEAEWIGWLNADEFYLPGVDLALSAALRAHPDADVVFGDVALISEEARLQGIQRHHRVSRFVLHKYATMTCSAAYFFRWSVLGEDPWDPELRIQMDRDLYLTLLDSGARFTRIPRVLTCYRIHGEQVSGKRNERWDAEDAILRDRYGHARLPSDLEQRLARYWHGLLKVSSGGYTAPRKARSLNGADMRWFSETVGSAAHQLVRTYS